MERSRARWREDERRRSEEEESQSVVAGVECLRIETAGTEEEAAEGLEAALEMGIEEEGEGKGGARVRAMKGVVGI